jgi:hypothetical protein
LSKVTFIAPELKRLAVSRSSVLALFRFAERRPLRGIASLVDWRLYGHLSRLVIDGFLSGEEGESLLMPLSNRLHHQYLLVLGLGDRERFGEAVFVRAVERMFRAAQGLGLRDLSVSLPGRVEETCGNVEAIEWFLACYEEHGHGQLVEVIEPAGAQKAMAPFVERWRLRQLVP